MSQEMTCIGSLLVADTPETHDAFQALHELLDLDDYDDISLEAAGDAMTFNLCISGWDVSPHFFTTARAAIIDFTTKHGISGGVFKTGNEEDDIMFLGPTPAARHQAHVKYLKQKLADLQLELAAAEDHDGVNFDAYLFDHEIPTSK